MANNTRESLAAIKWYLWWVPTLIVLAILVMTIRAFDPSAIG